MVEFFWPTFDPFGFPSTLEGVLCCCRTPTWTRHIFFFSFGDFGFFFLFWVSTSLFLRKYYKLAIWQHPLPLDVFFDPFSGCNI